MCCYINQFQPSRQEEKTMKESTLIPNQAYARLTSQAQIERTSQALKAHGFQVFVVESAQEAKDAFQQVVPAGAEVFTSSSTTLNQLGLMSEIDQPGGRYASVRVKFGQMDPKTQGREMQKMGATPEYVVGSVHAVTETGSLLVASASGSQLAPYAASAEHVIWMVGTQKIVPTIEEAFKRVEEYTYPLEDARALKAYGMNSAINKLLIVHREVNPTRATVILIKENLGF
jgi:L-lactate utilization protein LutC